MEEIPIVFIGHKDNGKSTLIGRLLLDTGSIKESRVKEIKEVDEVLGKEFELAHLVDAFREEREREMTIDTTRAFLKGNKRNYLLIDVPGHGELIANMLTGAAAAEVALLIVSITEGIKEQTVQHLEIANLLGIEQLGVVVNKMDEAGYKKEKFVQITEKLKKILDKIGYSLKDIYFFPISALEGDNVTKKSSKTPWYSGITLLDFLENEIRPPQSFDNLPLRFLIQDRYSEGEEEILVGKVESGKIKVNQEILFLPENKRTKITSIRDSEGKIKTAKAGQNIGITLLENFDISRGTVGVTSGDIPEVRDILEGEIFWLEPPSQKDLFFECGLSQVKGELREPKKIKAREKSPYKIKTEKPIVFDPQSKTILGKIVLKDKGKIIAVGNIK